MVPLVKAFLNIVGGLVSLACCVGAGFILFWLWSVTHFLAGDVREMPDFQVSTRDWRAFIVAFFTIILGFTSAGFFLAAFRGCRKEIEMEKASTTKPLLLTASALVCAIVPIFSITTDSSLLGVAAGAVIVLILSAASAVFLLISLPLWGYWLIKTLKDLTRRAS